MFMLYKRARGACRRGASVGEPDCCWNGPRWARGDNSYDRDPASDLDIARSAHLYIALHGDEAIARAREMVEHMRSKGDADGADR